MIGFRLDANKYIATGHMMRCIVIAKECIKKGQKCVFLLSDDDNVDILKKNNMDYRVINAEWDKWDESVSIVEQYVMELDIELLVVDSYYATEKFMSAINKVVPVFYIDDMCKQAYDISMVLHISQWDDENTLQELYKEKKNVKLLTGMKYMPLRDEFTNYADIKERRQIMITTGGTDPYHITLKVVQAMLKDDKFAEYNIVAVLGKMNNDKKELSDIAIDNTRLKVMQNISNMGEIMRQSCAAVSAGGGTVYELCLCDTPMVCFAFSDDHVGFEQKMQSHKILSYAGDLRDNEEETIRSIVTELAEILNDNYKNDMYRRNMRKLVDGKGAARIAEYLHRFLENKKLEAEYARRMLELVDGKGCERIVEVLCSK